MLAGYPLRIGGSAQRPPLGLGQHRRSRRGESGRRASLLQSGCSLGREKTSLDVTIGIESLEVHCAALAAALLDERVCVCVFIARVSTLRSGRPVVCVCEINHILPHEEYL